MNKVLLAGLLLFGVGCSEDPADPETSDLEAIQIAYFAELFETEPWTGAAAYCVSTGTWETRVDPSEEVLSELRLINGRVQPASLCQSTLQGTTYNGELARSYHIDSVVQTGASAVAEGFYRQHALEAGGYRAELQQQNGRWVVISFEMVWVA